MLFYNYVKFCFFFNEKSQEPLSKLRCEIDCDIVIQEAYLRLCHQKINNNRHYFN